MDANEQIGILGKPNIVRFVRRLLFMLVLTHGRSAPVVLSVPFASLIALRAI